MKRAIILFSLLCLVLLIIVLFLFINSKDESGKEPQLLSDRKIIEIQEIAISNQYDTYSVYQEGGGFAIADLPIENVNADYLLMLLDEAARVEYIELVSQTEKFFAASSLEAFGLEQPAGSALISFTTGDSLHLLFGGVERVSGGQYFMIKDDNAVYLMDHSRVVRFLQPLKRFINLEIVQTRSVPSPLSTIKYLHLSGRAFPLPIIISEARADSEDSIRETLSFGATTHLIRSPRLRKIDQKEAIDVFGSLSGLLNIEVLDYNCSDDVLAQYGFDDPLVRAEYIYEKSDGSEPVRIVLKAALFEGGYILVRDNQRIVHRIEKKAFLVTSYEKLTSRWFLTPFITDIQSIAINSGKHSYRFELSGEDNRSLKASLNNSELDMEKFRKFYTLLISAASDGQLIQAAPVTGATGQAAAPVLSVTFYYRDPHKEPDIMSFSHGSLRRLFVTVNGVTEFACLERYAQVLETALQALVKGTDFRTDW